MAMNRPASMTELLSDIEREWKALLGSVQRMSPQQMMTPDPGGWSPKDNLAHLAAWMLALMDGYMDGRPIEEVLDLPRNTGKALDEDAENAVVFKHNRDRSSEDVLKELNRLYVELTARLRSMPFEELLKPVQPEGKLLLDHVLGNTTEHFAEHRITIEKAL